MTRTRFENRTLRGEVTDETFELCVCLFFKARMEALKTLILSIEASNGARHASLHRSHNALLRLTGGAKKRRRSATPPKKEGKKQRRPKEIKKKRKSESKEGPQKKRKTESNEPGKNKEATPEGRAVLRGQMNRVRRDRGLSHAQKKVTIEEIHRLLGHLNLDRR